MNGTEWNNDEERQEFEAALTRALRRVDPPEGFAARVAALAEAEGRTAKAARLERTPWWRVSLGWKPAWGAMAAIAVAGVLAGHVVHERRLEEAKVQASHQFDVSVQITDRALEQARDRAREHLRRAGVPLDAEQ